MPGQQQVRETSAALVRSSGPNAGVTYPVAGDVARIGRSPENDIVVHGPDAAVVSAVHAEIRKDSGGGYRIADCGSTNGTYVDGQRVDEAVLTPRSIIQLGTGGPELAFVLEAPVPVDLNRTLEVPVTTITGSTAAVAGEDERLLREAIVRARIVRQASMADDHTVDIMRDMLGKALHKSRRPLLCLIAGMAIALAAVTAYGWAKVQDMREANAVVEARILGLERQLSAARNPVEADTLAASIESYQKQARALQSSALYRWGVGESHQAALRDIRILMSEFGAEVYVVPPEFLQQVNRFLAQYQGPDRPHMARALGEARPVIGRIRRILLGDKLPPDLAYMVLVESALDGSEESSAGCLGLWQFSPATAQAYGLSVGDQVDERLDVTKSTRAAAKYMKELILDFGSGSSVMLALAAYNVGPSKVKQAIRQRVQDPIKQRSFWYLYRVRALPEETREYVPKVIAAMIVGRHPERYGF